MNSVIPFMTLVVGLIILVLIVQIHGLEHPEMEPEPVPAPEIEQQIIETDHGRLFVEPNRICGEFEAARMGIRTHFGLVCIEQGMRFEKPVVIGGNLLSDDERRERVEPLVKEIDSLIKRRW